MKSSLKPVLQVVNDAKRFWVGNGFKVAGMMNYNKVGKHLNPFLVLDYNAPMAFEPEPSPKGIKFHPHRGIETVTISYDGGVTHCDSTGHSGTITKGGVQWMTSGSGILHEERHSDEFAKTGGPFEMVQMWINLPKAQKFTDPKYQVVQAPALPKVCISDKSSLRIIAGQYQGFSSPISTFTPMNIWDLDLAAKETFEVDMPEKYSAGILVRRGRINANGTEAEKENLVIFERDGTALKIESPVASKSLLFFGQAIEEPFVGKGPFVMNTEDELAQAFKDYKSGKFGPVPGPSVLDNVF